VIVVSDASPLIALSSVDRLDLLQRLFDTVVIPVSVRDEVMGAAAKISVELPSFIRVEPVAAELPVRFLKLNLHAGESEAIALALERGIQGIILDDKQAREIANELGLKVIGTLGLLILAKRKGFLSEVRPIMAQIIERVNFRIAPSVLNRALSLIDETPL
jgi:predicted nucleic acid-binding protein